MKLVSGTPAGILRYVAADACLLEIGRKAVEDLLVELRDDRVAQLRNNGLVIKEADGKSSDTIRLGPEDALRTGLLAIAAALEKGIET